MGIQQRRNALRALLILTIPLSLPFMGWDIYLHALALSVFNLTLIGVCLALLPGIRQDARPQRRSLIYLAVFLPNVLLALAEPNIQVGSTETLTLVPVIVYLILDERGAFHVTMGTFIAAVACYFIGAGVAPYRLNSLLFLHVMLSFGGLFVVCYLYTDSRRRSVNTMLDRALQDPLTGLWNREKLISAFSQAREQSARTGMPLSLLFIDLDYFKAINDRYGHDAGDKALVFFTQLMQRRLRQSDLICRIGGEEFAVLLRETSAPGALRVAESLRRSLADSDFRYQGAQIPMTLSAGVVELGRDGQSWADLYQAADSRLYACKSEGRNQVLSSVPSQRDRPDMAA